MSKTVKIILVVAVLGIVIITCLCLILGGFIALNTLSSTSTPIPLPAAILNTPTPRPVPTTAAPTVQPTELPSPEPGLPPTPTPLPADASFELDGVSLKVFSVQYSLINGGEDTANIVTNPDEFLVLVTLGSNNKELGFVYDNYDATTRLVDLVDQTSIEPDWLNWSGVDSPVNSGYVKISFPVKAAPKKAAIYFNDEVGVDITSMLPASDKPVDPWVDIKKKFEVGGIDLKVQSAILANSYTKLNGEAIKKDNPSDKILIVKLTSSVSDLSGLKDFDPIIIDGDNHDNSYYYAYVSWTTAENQGQGDIEFSYDLPSTVKNYIFYIPYDNLIDLTSIVKKK